MEYKISPRETPKVSVYKDNLLLRILGFIGAIGGLGWFGYEIYLYLILAEP